MAAGLPYRPGGPRIAVGDQADHVGQFGDGDAAVAQVPHE